MLSFSLNFIKAETQPVSSKLPNAIRKYLKITQLLIIDDDGVNPKIFKKSKYFVNGYTYVYEKLTKFPLKNSDKKHKTETAFHLK